MKLSMFMALLCCALSLFAFEVPFSTTPVITDENLITGLQRISPDDDKPDSTATRCWVWYDESNFYARIEMVKSADYTPAPPAARDNNINGDFVRIHLITNPESYSSCFFNFSSSGALFDVAIGLTTIPDKTWNSSYHYTVASSDTMLTFDAVIPFKDLRFRTSPPYDWRILVGRSYYKSGYSYVAPPLSFQKDGQKYYTDGIPILLTHRIKHSSNWKLKPYFVKSYDLVNKETTNDLKHLGIDVSFNPSTITKLKVSVNPDFSDVPPDNYSNIYNSKYPPYLFENRYFFTEDINAFGVDSQFFNTRKIVQPTIAGKYTGTYHGFVYGMLVAKDSEDQSGDLFQIYGIGNQSKRFGLNFTRIERSNDAYSNLVHVLQSDLEALPYLHIRPYYSYSQYYDGSGDSPNNLHGSFGGIMAIYSPKHIYVFLKKNWLSADYRNDLADFYDYRYFSMYEVDASYSYDYPDKFLRYYSLGANYGISNYHDPNLSASLDLRFPLNTGFSSRLSQGKEEYLGTIYDYQSASFGMSISQWDAFMPGFDLGWGNTLIYNLEAMRDYLSYNLSASGAITRKVRWSAALSEYTYDYDKVSFPYGPDVPIYMDNDYLIGSATLNYSFNNNLSWKNGLSYNTYSAVGAGTAWQYYSNFRWDLPHECSLYLGYKTIQSADEAVNFNHPFIPYQRNSASVYGKVSLTF